MAALAGIATHLPFARGQDIPGQVDFAGDRVVEAVLETRPRTPEQLLRAINLLIDLKRPAAAGTLLEQLRAAVTDDASRAALADRFGTAVFVKLSAQPELQPAGAEFAAEVLSAVDRRTPIQLNSTRSSNGCKLRRRACVEPSSMQLRRAGAPAVAALLEVLANKDRVDEHEAVRGALVGAGPDALPQLIGALESSDATFVAQVIEILGRQQRIEPTSATSIFCPMPHLMAAAWLDELPEPVRQAAQTALVDLQGRMPSAPQAAAFIQEQVLRFRQMADSPRDEFAMDAEPVLLWHWNAETGGLVAEQALFDEALIRIAALHAYAASALSPQDRTWRKLYLTTLLEAETYRLGTDQPLPTEPGDIASEVEAMGVDELVDLLEYALESHNTWAATAMARLLGNVASSEILQSDSGRLTTLVRAVNHPHRAVRFAALEALIRINPSRPFAGSSHVTKALGYFVATTGTPHAYVADVRSEEGSRLAALFTELGYHSEAAVDGRALVSRLANSPDCELLLIWIGQPRPTALDLLAAVRRDPRTALLPVGIVASVDSWERAEALARNDRRTMPIMRPHDVAGLQVQVDRLLDMSDRDLVPAEQRLSQASQALEWLTHLAERPRGVYDLRSLEPQLAVALSHPALSADAAQVLAAVGTPTAQRGLADLASRYNLPLEMRRGAYTAFCRHVERFGVQLTAPEILLQYDRYEAAAELDEESRELIGSIIDCIEARHLPHAALK